MIELPEPSRRGWLYPLPEEALPHLVHPNPRHKFHRPFKDAHGNIVTYNGGLAVRIRTALPGDIGLAEGYFEMHENCLPWPDPEEEERRPQDWRKLDDAAAQVWHGGAKSAFFEVKEGVVPNKLTALAVGSGAVVPMPLLQLMARLPAARVFTGSGPGEAVVCLFNGGEAVIRPCVDLPPPWEHVLKPVAGPVTRTFYR